MSDAAQVRRYRSTPAGRQATQEANARYASTAKGKEAIARYNSSSKRREAEKRRQHSTRGFWRRCVERDVARGHSGTLSPEQVEALVSPMTCALTGMRLSWEGGRKEPLYPSLDRIDRKKGYEPGNVQCVALWVNLARNETPLDVFKAVLAEFKSSSGGGTDAR